MRSEDHTASGSPPLVGRVVLGVHGTRKENGEMSYDDDNEAVTDLWRLAWILLGIPLAFFAVWVLVQP